MKAPSLALVLAAFALAFPAGRASAEQSAYPPAVTAAFVSNLRQHVNGVLSRKCLPTFAVRNPASAIAPRWRPGVVAKWIRRHRYAHRAHDSCASYWAWAERDFHRPLLRAATTFGVTYSWLHSCDHSEGSDAMVPNHQGSDAYGPMQFFSSTFTNNVAAAFRAARALGVRIPWAYARRDSNVGQAFVAAYMFRRGWSSQWTGAGC